MSTKIKRFRNGANHSICIFTEALSRVNSLEVFVWIIVLDMFDMLSAFYNHRLNMHLRYSSSPLHKTV